MKNLSDPTLSNKEAVHIGSERMRTKLKAGFFGVALTIAFVWPFPVNQTLAETTMAQDKLISMLAAINRIRTPRYIELDCAEFIYPHLGRHQQLGYYIDLFAANGIAPAVVRQHENYHVGFEIGRRHLESVPNSKFGKLDVVAIVFVATGRDRSSTVRSCKAALKAAPQHL